MRLSERIADTIDDIDTALRLGTELRKIKANGADKEAEGCQWRLRKMELELEDVTHDRDELLHDLHEYEASSDRMQEELYIAQNDREKFAKALREIKVNGA